MEVDQRTNAVTGANLVIEGPRCRSGLRGPKSRGTGRWGKLRESVVGRAAPPRPAGAFDRADRAHARQAGRRPHRLPSARFMGVDGRRWLLRGLSGKALADPSRRAAETLVSRLAHCAAPGAMAPQSSSCTCPASVGVNQIRSGPLDPLARGRRSPRSDEHPPRQRPRRDPADSPPTPRCWRIRRAALRCPLPGRRAGHPADQQSAESPQAGRIDPRRLGAAPGGGVLRRRRDRWAPRIVSRCADAAVHRSSSPRAP